MKQEVHPQKVHIQQHYINPGYRFSASQPQRINPNCYQIKTQVIKESNFLPISEKGDPNKLLFKSFQNTTDQTTKDHSTKNEEDNIHEKQ